MCALVQDDAHIFCTEDQLQDEAADFIRLLLGVYRDFGFNDIIVRLATRPDKRVGTDEQWDKAEKALAAFLKAAGLNFEVRPGKVHFMALRLNFIYGLFKPNVAMWYSTAGL